MKIIIDKKSHDILPMSKLSFEAFNKIIVKEEIFELKEYIALFVDMSVKNLMDSEIKTFSMAALHASIFDIDIEKTVKTKPETFYYENDTHILLEMTLSTFGQNYIFDLYYEKYRAKKINYYQLCVYALSCYLSKEYSTREVKKHYDELKKMEWRIILPVAFFLGKKFLRKKNGFLKQWLTYTSGLKKMTLLSSYKMKSYKSSIKKLLDKF